MERDAWDRIRLGRSRDERVWELFHENSKTHRYSGVPSDADVAAVMVTLWEDLPYAGYPAVDLPIESLPAIPLGETMARRRTPRAFQPSSMDLASLSAILRSGYGIAERPSAVGHRAFRSAPSGGALYPLEVYLYARSVEGLDQGLYHYHAVGNALQRLSADLTPEEVAPVLVQPEFATTAAVVVFFTALFERSTFKYGERGYRFVLIEAGHVAQNMNLAASALGLATVNIGGYFDRDADRLLGIDGVEQSTVYMMAIGLP